MKRMHGSLALLGAASLFFLAGACQKQALGADPDAIKNAIKADETKWNAQFKSNDAEGLLSHYSDDAYFVAPGVQPADGSTAIRKVYADALSDKNFSVTFASDRMDVAASGDLAYARGHFSEQYTDPKTGQVMTNKGSYISVYKKQQDGSWKVVEDIAAADPSSQKPVPPEKPATRAKMVSF